MKLRKRTWEIVELSKRGDKVSRLFDISILVLIFLNVVAVIVGSVQYIQDRCGVFLDAFETLSVFVFTLEYLARLWSCTIDPRFSGSILGRIRLILRPMSMIDLLSILPFYLTFTDIDLRALRSLRLLRIVRILKLGRYYSSLNLILYVLRSKKEELVLSTALLGLLLVISSCLLYFCEYEVQPEAFSSIPATMWCAIATLTTVGYGDMFPITFVGRLFAGVIAILGIGMLALPTAILGAGFIETLHHHKESKKNCPHCGKHLD